MLHYNYYFTKYTAPPREEIVINYKSYANVQIHQHKLKESINKIKIQ